MMGFLDEDCKEEKKGSLCLLQLLQNQIREGSAAGVHFEEE